MKGNPNASVSYTVTTDKQTKTILSSTELQLDATLSKALVSPLYRNCLMEDKLSRQTRGGFYRWAVKLAGEGSINFSQLKETKFMD